MTFTKEQKTHHLKIYPEHFSAVLTGVKRAELRKNDRDFKVGDTLHLMETPKGSCLPTGEFVNAVVTGIGIFHASVAAAITMVSIMPAISARPELTQSYASTKTTVIASVPPVITTCQAT